MTLYALSALEASRGMRQPQKNTRGWGGEHIVHLPSKYLQLKSLNRVFAHHELKLITPYALPGYTQGI